MGGGGGGNIPSLNGVTAVEAIEDYWSSGWSANSANKRALAQDLAMGEDEFAKRYAEGERAHDQELAEWYRTWDTREFRYESDRQNQYIKNIYKEGADRLSSGYDYEAAARERYGRYVASASADVAKRMGYNTSAYKGIGSVTPSDLRKAMGTTNANKLMNLVQDSAQTAIDNHKKSKKK